MNEQKTDAQLGDAFLKSEYAKDIPESRKELYREAWGIKKQNWQALQHFYKMKSVLLPEFITRNKRALNLIESKLMEQYQYEDVLTWSK
jgi:hypothetical protein